MKFAFDCGLICGRQSNTQIARHPVETCASNHTNTPLQITLETDFKVILHGLFLSIILPDDCLYFYFPDISQFFFLPSLVLDLIYWRNLATTGVVFTGLVVGLASLFQLSAITILSNLGLSIMAFTLPVRLLYKAMTVTRLNDGSHPFQ